EGRVEGPELAHQRRVAVYVARCPDGLGDLAERHRLAIELAVLVPEIRHPASPLPAGPARGSSRPLGRSRTRPGACGNGHARRALGIGCSICTDVIFACKALMTPATGESWPCGQARLMTRRNSLFITKRGMIRWLVLETRRQMLGSE